MRPSPTKSSTPPCPDENHPHWIDLGLPTGTQWRCCNEGASWPEEYGNYCKFDAAQAYNPPTPIQIRELLDNCISEWMTLYGVNGRKFTGPNGNTIFLPAAGYRLDVGRFGAGEEGRYWLSTPIDEQYAGTLNFNSDGADTGPNYRGFGHSVRPVR